MVNPVQNSHLAIIYLITRIIKINKLGREYDSNLTA